MLEPALKKWPILCIETQNLRIERMFKSHSICPNPPCRAPEFSPKLLSFLCLPPKTAVLDQEPSSFSLVPFLKVIECYVPVKLCAAPGRRPFHKGQLAWNWGETDTLQSVSLLPWPMRLSLLGVFLPHRAHTGGNRLMFLSHTDVSLPLFLPPFPFLQK